MTASHSQGVSGCGSGVAELLLDSPESLFVLFDGGFCVLDTGFQLLVIAAEDSQFLDAVFDFHVDAGQPDDGPPAETAHGQQYGYQGADRFEGHNNRPSCDNEETGSRPGRGLPDRETLRNWRFYL